MTRFIVLFSLALMSQSTLAAGPNVNQIAAVNFARDARDKAFLTEISLGHALVESQKAKFLLGHLQQLLPSNAISKYDYVRGLLRVMQAEFEMKRLKAELAEAKAWEKGYQLQADWAGGQKASPKALAEVFVELREQHYALSQNLVHDMAPYTEQLLTEAKKFQDLFDSGTASSEESYEVISEAAEAKGLRDLAQQHIKDSKALLDDARRDWKAAEE